MRLASSSARIHGAEGVDDQQEQERHRILHHVPDHAAVGIDVDRRVGRARDPLLELVEQADLRIAQHAPGHRGQDRRNEERQRDQHFERAAERRVGARAGSRPAAPRATIDGMVLASDMPTVLSSDEQVLLRQRSCAIAVEIERAGHARRRRMQAAVEQHRQRIDRQEREQQRPAGSGRRCGRPTSRCSHRQAATACSIATAPSRCPIRDRRPKAVIELLASRVKFLGQRHHRPDARQASPGPSAWRSRTAAHPASARSAAACTTGSIQALA